MHAFVRLYVSTRAAFNGRISTGLYSTNTLDNCNTGFTVASPVR